MNILELSDRLIRKFKINIDYILKCSDNNIEDLRNEAFIVVFDNYDKIMDNEKVFINELRSKCLKFNKYNRRIESKKLFEKFNEYENRMVIEESNKNDFDEDKLCTLLSIQNMLNQEDYEFLIKYYSLGGEELSKQLNLAPSTIRKRVSNLLKTIRKELNIRK